MTHNIQAKFLSTIKSNARQKILIGLIAAIVVLVSVIVLQKTTIVHAVQQVPPANENFEAGILTTGFADIVDAVADTVVSIRVVDRVKQDTLHWRPFSEERWLPWREFNFPKEFWRNKENPKQFRNRTGFGSGVIVDSAGYIVTNYHVIANANEITVGLASGESYDATLVGYDRIADLAVLKIDSQGPLPYATFGDSDSARVGEWVIAIGSPFGFQHTTTLGIVAAKRPNLRPNMNIPMLQIDVAINRGNSGGPLFNIKGEVIGINTLLAADGMVRGLGFAVPSSVADDVVAKLIAHGRVPRGNLGVTIQDLSEDLVEVLGLEDTKGVIVTEVDKNSAAHKAGIQTGDVILTFDDQPVTSVADLVNQVRATDPGTSVDVNLWRNPDDITLPVTLGDYAQQPVQIAGTDNEQNSEETSAKASIGVLVSDLTDEFKSSYNLSDDAEGVVIVEVKSDGPAIEAGLRAGDVIKNVNNRKITTGIDVSDEINKLADAGESKALMLIEREGQNQYYVVDIRSG